MSVSLRPYHPERVDLVRDVCGMSKWRTQDDKGRVRSMELCRRTEGTGVAVPKMGLRESRAVGPQREGEPRNQGREQSGKKSVPVGGCWSSVVQDDRESASE